MARQRRTIQEPQSLVPKSVLQSLRQTAIRCTRESNEAQADLLLMIASRGRWRRAAVVFGLGVVALALEVLWTWIR